MPLIDQFIELVSRYHRILLVAGPIALLLLYLVLKAILRSPKKPDTGEQKKRAEPQPQDPTEKAEPRQADETAKEEDRAQAEKRGEADRPDAGTPDSLSDDSAEREDRRRHAESERQEEPGQPTAPAEMERYRPHSGATVPESTDISTDREEFEAEIASRETIAADSDMTPERHDDHYLVDVFFATDRNRSADYGEIFTGDRHPGEMLSFGSLQISVPLHHEVGEIEQPGWWHVLLGVNRDPNRFFTIRDIEDFEERAFFERLDAFQNARRAREAFLFIHGYNNSFVDAAFRTGQIAFDMRFRGAGILFSWPSQGSLTSYYSDAENAKWTVPHLEDFLIKLSAVPSIKVLHLIAHSMGNQALTAALENLSLGGTVPAFNQVVLTAPDIDAGVFAQISNRIVAAAERVTLYASENDRALHASRQFTSYPRLGDISDGVFILDGIDTIDASNVDTDILGHGYFAKSESVLTDIDRLLSGRRPPGERPGLSAVALSDGRTYWTFGP